MREVVGYDGGCGMCRGAAWCLRRLDWAGRLEVVDLAARTGVPEALRSLGPAGELAGMPMVGSDGSVVVGMEAVRRALSRTALGRPMAWVLGWPWVRGVVERWYGRVARGRRREGGC